jgi:hypothetical protein
LEDIRVAVSSLPNTIAGLRDKALLLLGFMAARRRSEIVGLDFGSLGEGATGFVQITAEGLLIYLARSKTDQEGAGLKIAVPRRRDDLCEARRLIVKKRIGDFDTAHGLRAGFITEGARRGASDRELRRLHP